MGNCRENENDWSFQSTVEKFIETINIYLMSKFTEIEIHNKSLHSKVHTVSLSDWLPF